MRWFLSWLGLLMALHLSGGLGFASGDLGSATLGISQDGQPLTLYSIGTGPRHVLIVGGQHGGPEANTVELVGALLEYFIAEPQEIPAGLELDVVLAANPDGLAAGRRQFASGVDPNRNWGGQDWSPDAYDSNGIFRIGLGGPEPFSEQETRAVADWILTTRPALVINYHSAGGFMFGPREGLGAELAQAYADGSGYLWPGGPDNETHRNPLPYRTNGSMSMWLRDMGVPGILVELSTPRGTDVERNLAGLMAVLQVIGSLPQPHPNEIEGRA